MTSKKAREEVRTNEAAISETNEAQPPADANDVADENPPADAAQKQEPVRKKTNFTEFDPPGWPDY